MKKIESDQYNSEFDPTPQKLNQSFLEIHSIARSYVEQATVYPDKRRPEVLERLDLALTESLNQVSEMLTMIQHFRDVSARRGTETPRLVSTMIKDLLDQVLHAMQYTSPLANATVVKMIPRTLSPIRMPRGHLETIFFHLLEFARQEINGHVGMITIEAHENGEHEVSGNGRHQGHEICVSYNATKRTPADISCFFDPFYEGTMDAKRERLGLFVVKQLIDYHRGTVEVKVSPKDTTFQITFPKA